MSYYEDICTPEDECIPDAVVSKKLHNNEFTLTEMRKINESNFCSVKKVMNKRWKDHYLRSVTLSYYKTIPNAGARIVHAISGDYLPGVVGSAMEDRYFKVKMASRGESENGTLFYLTPSEYENHQYCEVSQDSVDAWARKQPYV